MGAVRGCNIPEDLMYNIESNVWAKREADGNVTVGLTSYACSLAGDIVSYTPKKVGKAVEKDKSCATVESGKWVGPVKTPVAGEVVAVNEAVTAKPGAINQDPYNQGWIKAGEVITSTPLAGLPLAAEPSGLATVTPLPRVELSLTAFDGHYQFMNINSKGVFGTVTEPALVYEVTTAEALQSFLLEVFSPTGKLVYKRRLKTDDEGTYENAVMTKDFKAGAYTVRATLWNGVVKEVVVQVTGDSS